MFERIQSSEPIYKGVVKTSYKKPTWSDANRDGHIMNKRGESASSQNHQLWVRSLENAENNM